MSSVTLPFPNADNYEQWATDELAVLGAPNTQSNVNALVAWGDTEGGWAFNTATYNVLDTSRDTNSAGQSLGGTPINSDGVLAFPTLLAGLEANAATIEQSNMSGIDASLMGGDASETLQAGINSSAWGGYGQPQDNVAAILNSGIRNYSVKGGTDANVPVSSQSSPVTGGAALTSSTSPSGPTLGSVGPFKISLPYGLVTKVVLAILGLILLLMGIHQITKGGNSPGQTVVQPIQQAGAKAKGLAQTAGVMAAA